ncbi:helix-turn-helix domain-containing protein [Marinicellulosiphila megalodicopiae]|uniref:helix-turn-helix domain-containing protein n=1 Tax=Marinicellulosiphila megalodicopiae TaxID=2724896 RepID=UPI003BAFD7F7
MIDERIKLFGQKVREARKSQGLSQEAFAHLSGIDRSYMGKIERGENNITLARAYEISDALNVTLNMLIE